MVPRHLFTDGSWAGEAYAVRVVEDYFQLKTFQLACWRMAADIHPVVDLYDDFEDGLCDAKDGVETIVLIDTNHRRFSFGKAILTVSPLVCRYIFKR